MDVWAIAVIQENFVDRYGMVDSQTSHRRIQIGGKRYSSRLGWCKSSNLYVNVGISVFVNICKYI